VALSAAVRVVIARAQPGRRPGCSHSLSVIVGRLCQTPLPGKSIGVSQKRPTNLLTVPHGRGCGRSASPLYSYGVGRGCGVGRGLGNGVGLGAAVGVGVGVGVTVGAGVGVTVGVGVTAGVAVAVGVGVG
jgi:hypothetical protein